MEDLIAINEEKLNRLSLDIIKYSQRANIIFNKILNLVYQSKSYINGEIGDNLYKKVNLLKDSMNATVYNLKLYSDDLVRAKIRFKSTSSDIATYVNKQRSNLNYTERKQS